MSSFVTASTEYIFKAYVAIYLVTNTFNITMAVFDVGQHVVNNAAGVISGNTAVDASEAVARIVDALEDMELGDLFLLSMETMLISITMRILSIIITVILYGRMIEIYRASRSAAFHPKAVCGHFGNPALASR